MRKKSAHELFIVGFNGETLPSSLSSTLSEQNLGGIIHFKRNITSLEQLIALNGEIITIAADQCPLLCVDQEGGRVARLRGILSDIPPLRTLTPVLSKNPELAFRLGALQGRELVALGFHLNFAPVADVALNQACEDIIGDRSFSEDPNVVAPLVAAWIKGLQSSGIAACAKHFPGHGGTVVDSHFALPTITTDVDTLENQEILPFKAAIDSNVATIMTAHIIVKMLDREYPATMSRPILQGILRDRLHFNNVVISDDLDMRAVADHYNLRDIIEHSLMASVDMFIIGNNWDKFQEAVAITEELQNTNHHIAQKIEEARARINLLKNRYIGCPASPQLEYAQTVVRCAPHLASIAQCIG